MTTSLAETNAPDVLDQLRAVHAADPHPDDVPGLSHNQRRALDERRAHRERIMTGLALQLDLLARPTARLARAHAERAVWAPIQADLARELSERPDWREITDRRERDAEWVHQQGLSASLKALQTGVEFFNGHAAVPSPLRERLTQTCPTCSHSTLEWYGSFPSLDAEIERHTRTIAEIKSSIASLIMSAALVLDDATVTTATADAPM
jgi:hypothetical protein